MAKVLLLAPYLRVDIGVGRYDQNVMEPGRINYGELLLGTILKKAGHNIRIFDMSYELVKCKGDEVACLAAMADTISEMQPDIVGISFFTFSVVEAKTIMRHAREYCNKVGLKPIFIAGGIHPTVEPERTLREIDVDYVCIGEGENVLLALAEGKDPHSIPNLASRERLSPPIEHIKDLDSLPFMDYELIDWLPSVYANTRTRGRKFSLPYAYLFMSRGCAYACNFCAFNVNRPLRFHSSDYIIEYMRYLERAFGVQKFWFQDSTVGSNWNLLEEFCEKMIAESRHGKWEWYAYMRANQVDRQRLKLMRRAGCAQITYGYESGSQDELDRMNKGTTVADNYRAGIFTREAGINFQGNAILNYPGQTLRDIRETEHLLLALQPSQMAFGSYVPLPGSVDYSRFSSPDTDIEQLRLMGISSNEAPTKNYSAMDESIIKLWYHRFAYLRYCWNRIQNDQEKIRMLVEEWEMSTSRLSMTIPKEWHSFFHKTGTDLSSCWNFCTYSDKGKISHDANGDSVTLATIDDHVPTEYIELPDAGGKTTQILRIELRFANLHSDEYPTWILFVQDEQYNTLAQFKFTSVSQGGFQETFPVIQLFGLPKKIRLVFSAVAIGNSRLPCEMILSSNIKKE